MAEGQGNALPSGTALEGHRVDGVLGAGGFGITYRALDLALERHVAIKEYLPRNLAMREEGSATVRPISATETEDYEYGLEKFQEEARTLVRFRHPNIVPVHKFFEANGTAYLVMEYVEGDSLYGILGRGGTLTAHEVEEILHPLLDGLEVVHKAGFLHRDIKPGNIFIRADGTPVLIDFGAARQSLGHATQTMTGIITPGYAPFEQYSSRSRQGPWSDIYALGATIYRSVTGEKPTDAANRMVEDDYVPAAEAAKGDFPPRLMSAIDRALALKAAERPQSVAEWRAILGAPAPAQMPEQAPAKDRELQDAAATDPAPQPAAQQPSAPSTRSIGRRAPVARRPALIGLAAVVALAVTGGAVLFIRSGGTPDRPTPKIVAKPTPAPQSTPAPKPSAPPQSIPRPRPKATPAPPPPSPALRPRPRSTATAPGKTFRDCRDCPLMVVLPAGANFMGTPEKAAWRDDERPRHRVTIAKRFAIGRYEVTTAEWGACVADGACRKPATGQSKVSARSPVTGVSWKDTDAYVRWLTRKTGQPYRLPSEAEWEYAARAGTTTRFWWGDRIGRNLANCARCGSRWDGRGVTVVGSFRPNRFGLHDVSGNAWEWVRDCYNPNHRGAPETGAARTTGDCALRVLRGGGYRSSPRNLRSAARIARTLDQQNDSAGLRVVAPIE